MLRSFAFAALIVAVVPVAAEPSPPPGLWLRRGCLNGAQMICQYEWQDGESTRFPLMYKQVLSTRAGAGEDFEFLYRCTPKPTVVRVTRAASLGSLRRWTSAASLKAQCRR